MSEGGNGAALAVSYLEAAAAAAGRRQTAYRRQIEHAGSPAAPCANLVTHKAADPARPRGLKQRSGPPQYTCNERQPVSGHLEAVGACQRPRGSAHLHRTGPGHFA